MRLEAPSRTADGGGGAVLTWQLVSMVWAESVAMSGREAFEADGLAARAMHEIRLRHRADISTEMRFVMGSRVLDIRAVRDPDGRRCWLSCLCEERAP